MHIDRRSPSFFSLSLNRRRGAALGSRNTSTTAQCYDRDSGGGRAPRGTAER